MSADPPPIGKLRLDIVRTDEAFLALEPDWDRLLELSQTRSPFMRWDWISLWRQHFQKDYDLAIAVIRDASQRPLAIAPFALGGEMQGARRCLRHLFLIGSLGEVQGERLDFLVPSGQESELTPLLLGVFERLSAEWQAVRLNKIPEESANLPYILAALNQCGVGAGLVHISECQYARLPGAWTEYEATHSSRWRRNMRKRWESFDQELQGERVEISNPEKAQSTISHFGRLHAMHFPAGVSSFLRKRAWEFHQKLAEKWLQTGRAVLPYLAIKGQMVAGIYGFIEGGEFFQYQMGWDPAFAKISIGNLAIGFCMQSCVQKGMSVYDMLPGSYRYKAEWCSQGRRVVDVEAYHPESFRALIFRGIRGLTRWWRQCRYQSAKAETSAAEMEGGMA